jgi:antibiotic biosynthesis monooxygenase (ABM) superfamily enzyme
VNRAARGFDGFEGTESYPPESGASNQWVAVFRFSRVDQLSVSILSWFMVPLVNRGLLIGGTGLVVVWCVLLVAMFALVT